jgi:uncharacterized RDD family membrane protein YckC
MTASPVAPESGAGSVASFGARLLAFLVDAALCVVLAIVTGNGPGSSRYGIVVYAAFLLVELLFVTLAGQTPGMRVAGVVVVRAGDNGKPQLRWVLVRTLLLAAVVPAVIPDRKTGRWLHDRASGLATVRTR